MMTLGKTKYKNHHRLQNKFIAYMKSRGRSIGRYKNEVMTSIRAACKTSKLNHLPENRTKIIYLDRRYVAG